MGSHVKVHFFSVNRASVSLRTEEEHWILCVKCPAGRRWKCSAFRSISMLSSHSEIRRFSLAHKELMVIHSRTKQQCSGGLKMCWSWRSEMVVTDGPAPQWERCQCATPGLPTSDMMYEVWKAAQNRSEKRNLLFHKVLAQPKPFLWLITVFFSIISSKSLKCTLATPWNRHLIESVQIYI